jgi:hypothetical protein
VIRKIQKTTYIDADWESSIYTFDMIPEGMIQVDYLILSVGSYKLDIYINDRKVTGDTDGIFEVSQ